MIVTFISQCEKKAIPKTQRVLDSFANRIGDRTWQTVITNDGLLAVKKLLRKTASKNTAVSCHLIHGRKRTELMWIVGNRSKFNREGIVPVSTTQKDLFSKNWENDWNYLPLIKSLSAMAALFHDWGKSSDFFQAKLKKSEIIGDPLRHEWISILFLDAFVNGESDEQWLTRLSEGDISTPKLIERVKEKQNKINGKFKIFKNQPNGASLIAWLILSHHRFPITEDFRGEIVKGEEFKILLEEITQEWGYENQFENYIENLQNSFTFSKGMPCDSSKWMKYARKQASKLNSCLDLLENSIKDGSWRLILHYSRLVLMLGDHYHSSQDADLNWKDELDLFANTDRKSGELKQKLGEHLLGVAKQAVRNAHLLPAFEGDHQELQKAYDVKILKEKSPSEYKWQDMAVDKIKNWRKESEGKQDNSHFGFFAVNMASTGTGKTFANAKIMRALSVDDDSLRYILALGLRTLTLQTGDEYRERIGLGNDELAVLIGSKAVLSLHERNKHGLEKDDLESYGSESEESLLMNELIFESEIPEKDLATILTDTKSRKFLYAPVLSCTIDHLMSATETKRGGRYILPALRLMSSDLVIDEIDDFDGEDLVAIGRLIHLAAMLGRKVMISSATIPPDLAEGYFNAYKAGWVIFAKMRNRSSSVACAWVDEFNSKISDIRSTDSVIVYNQLHQKFVEKRLEKLQKQVPKRKANIISCDLNCADDKENATTYFYSVIFEAILEKHSTEFNIDEKTGKQVSFGVVRIANISPCVGMTKYLLDIDLPEDFEIRTMAYHSQQFLVMRNEQEKHLDSVLKKQKNGKSLFDQSEIRQHLDNIKAKNVIFVLVATPVEEVGRDHDFDWAVVEPSSYRSFIQIAGRVRRHGDPKSENNTTNMTLLQYNLKGLQQKQEPVFCRPGYESKGNPLKTHNLNELVDKDSLSARLDASPRISRNKILYPQRNLSDLEHEAIHKLLTNYEQQGPETMEGWLSGCWWLTAIPQLFVKFRRSSPQLTVYLVPFEDEWKFVEKDNYGKVVIREKTYGIERDMPLTESQTKRLWLTRDYEQLIYEIDDQKIFKTALVYGEIGLPTYGKETDSLGFIYSEQLGLIRK
ncbi:MAG: type I-F CRISPR-associated helicase Cas3f [Spirochaetaceae bacterium]|jgi:CRISPR-associated endonuclease/helicase Cas3|nr:type I-F CRISPR-associated helicase Cas3f [Spirochaetaceae bacterium]